MHPVVNCTLVTLIPKSHIASTLNNMRPIACCTTIYKIISKILNTRLNKVINYVVDDNQSAFVHGKFIHYNIIIACELLRGHSRKNISPRCSIQMDIQKEHGTIEWTILEEIMKEMNFPTKFISWILVCV